MSDSHLALFLVSQAFLCLWEESALAEYQGEVASQPPARMDEDETSASIKQVCLKIRDLLTAAE